MEVARAHSLLRVSPGASGAELRAAYRTRLLGVHPDGGGGGDPEAIAALRSAYRTIVERGIAPVPREPSGRPHIDVYA